MKTRDKIIHVALELFNQQGERHVTTNHIAAHMQISPGNLYYHFRNKQEIVRELFALYATELLERFAPIKNQKESLALLKQYLDSICTLMWKYRFFYANLPDILQQDTQLQDEYIQLQDQLQANLMDIMGVFVSLGLLKEHRDDLKALVTTLHMIAYSWLGYQAALSKNAEITEQVVFQGMLQMIAVVKPHTTRQGREQLQLLEEGIKASHSYVIS